MSEKEMRELDAWIAEHVFELNMTTFDGEPAVIIGKSRFCPEDDLCASVQHYTADPAAAMQVLEKCGAFECVYAARVGKEWIVGDEPLRAEGCSKTLPLAICLFAKKLFSHDPPTRTKP